jgi:F-type H+-transporting ATPase subunit epsilon
MSQIQCIVVTPETTVLEQPVEFVALPLFDGELGILPGHAPLIGRLGYGELRLKNAGVTEHFYVDGGFVQVANNVVSVLTNKAVAVTKLDAAAATAQLEEARHRKADTPELLAIRERLELQARAQLRLAAKAH